MFFFSAFSADADIRCCLICHMMNMLPLIYYYHRFAMLSGFIAAAITTPDAADAFSPLFRAIIFSLPLIMMPAPLHV